MICISMLVVTCSDDLFQCDKHGNETKKTNVNVGSSDTATARNEYKYLKNSSYWFDRNYYVNDKILYVWKRDILFY